MRTISISFPSRLDTIQAKEINTRSRVRFDPVLSICRSVTHLTEQEQKVISPKMSSLLLYCRRVNLGIFVSRDSMHTPDERISYFLTRSNDNKAHRNQPFQKGDLGIYALSSSCLDSTLTLVSTVFVMPSPCKIYSSLVFRKIPPSTDFRSSMIGSFLLMECSSI
jgi:hypothetical protein